jgi:nucleotide-binding universal stress UspA family protein
MKVLLAVDGSPLARKACRYLINHWEQYVGDGSLTLIHVDPSLPGDVAMALGKEGVERYHRDNHRDALRAVKTALKRAGRSFEERMQTGSPGESIASIARSGRFDLVVMGSHGHGAFRALLLGSVVSKVLGSCTVPVLIIR